MKNTEMSELKGLPVNELAERAATKKEELFNLRFQLRTGQLTDTSRLRAARRDYAAIRTLIAQKEKAQHGAA
jgi:large subunit ribosomal protein L29